MIEPSMQIRLAAERRIGPDVSRRRLMKKTAKKIYRFQLWRYAGGTTPRRVRTLREASDARRAVNHLLDIFTQQLNRHNGQPGSVLESHNMQQHDTKKLLDVFWDQFDWSDQDNVLDFGCGDGDTTRRILADNIPK